MLNRVWQSCPEGKEGLALNYEIFESTFKVLNGSANRFSLNIHYV